MITLYYHQGLKLGIVTTNGMPTLVLTDDKIVEFEHFICDAQLIARQAGKSDALRSKLEVIMRYPDETVGWQRL